MNGAQISRIAIWGMLLAALYLTFQSGGKTEEDLPISVPMRGDQQTAVIQGHAQSASSTLPVRHWTEEAAKDPFQTIAWYVSPQPQVPKPQRPEAPPVPYKYFGKMMDDGVPRAFLYQGDHVVVVKVGDVLGNNYRVESIAPESVSFTYLPLGTRQFVLFGVPAPEISVADAQQDEQGEAAPVSKPEKLANDNINVQAIQEMARQATLK
jgi:hypothetical protein